MIFNAKFKHHRNMKRTIYILTLTFFISSCGTIKQQSNHQESDQNFTTSDTTNLKQRHQKLTNLDNIDKENNKSVLASGDNITKASVDLKNQDSTINLTANIRKDHRIFGYAKPTVNSERLLLLSVFTNDVEHNPFDCKLGAYYDTAGMKEMTLKYISTSGKYVKAAAIDKLNNSTTVYFEKKWIEFD